MSAIAEYQRANHAPGQWSRVVGAPGDTYEELAAWLPIRFPDLTAVRPLEAVDNHEGGEQ